MNFEPGLKQGDVIYNNTLQEIFRCSSQGGMRRSRRTNSLVIISDYTRSIYEDRWEGDVFHYTGMGLEGDQSLDSRQNKTLAQSHVNGVSVFLFEVFIPKQYFYQGQVELAGSPYQEQQLDRNDNLRSVWVFPLKLAGQLKPALLPESIIVAKQDRSRKEAKRLKFEELQRKTSTLTGESGSRNAISTVYERNTYVAEYAKIRARGICQLCNCPAPFHDKNGEPFLETHHIVWLAKGGKDLPSNTVALCPNCHRKMHVLDLEEDKETLKKSANT